MSKVFHLNLWIAVGIFLLLGCGCSLKQRDLDKDVSLATLPKARLFSSQSVLTEAELAESSSWAEYSRAMALLQEGESKGEEALDELAKALAKHPQETTIQDKIYSIVLETKQFEKGLRIFAERVAAEPQNPKLNGRYAYLLYLSGKREEAVTWMEEVYRKSPVFVKEYAYLLIYFHTLSKRFDKANVYFEKCAAVERGKLSFHTGYVSFLEDWREASLKDKNILFPPELLDRRMAYAQELVTMEVHEEAEIAAIGILLLRLHCVDLCKSFIDNNLYGKLSQSSPFLNLRYQIAVLEEDTEMAAELAERIWEAFPKERTSRGGALLEAMVRGKRYAIPIKTLEKQLSKQSENDALRLRLALLYLKANQPDRGLALFAMRQYKNPLVYSLMGAMYLHKHQFKEALAHLEKARQLAESQKLEKFCDVFFYFNLSNCYDHLGDADKAIANAKKAYDLSPNDPSTCNGYGYLLADYDRELPWAEKLISTAVAADPTNASYLDSLAWVYFKLKKYPLAEKYIRLAIQYGGMTEDTEGVIAEHAGFIFETCGNLKLALFFFEQALQSSDERHSQAIRETLQKLRK